MGRYIYIIVLLFISTNIFAQFFDDFSDGDITTNPIWIGNIDSFIVNANYELQLNANDAGTSYISTASSVVDSTEWRFKVDINLSPSANNNISIFLVSDVSDITGDINGYYIKIGENLSDDGIDLYKKTGSTSTKIIDGTAGVVANGGLFNIKVIRDNSGNWEIFADDTGGENFVSQGTVFDNSITSSAYFGIFVKYTSTNTSNFKFDDIYVGNVLVDTIPASLTNLQVLNDTSLQLSFSERITQTSAENINNYNVSIIGNPTSAQLQANQTDVLLNFSQQFVSAQQYNLSISNIEDLEGNIASQIDTSFMFVEILQNDIVINEIMADPNPSVGLPVSEEWIEIYNTKDYDISTSGWKLVAGSSTKTLPDFTISANSYLTICDDDSLAYFQSFGDAISLATFPSLTNTGATISILDENDQIISTVSYTDDWYQDETKKNGGYTLERIDPLNNCSAMGNWIASNASIGGTPSTQNSVFANNQDTIPPSVISFSNDGVNKLYITFSEEVDASLTNIANYQISPNSITNIIANGTNTVQIQLADTLISEMEYSLIVSNIKDICGNTMQDTSLSFTHYNVKKYDLLINEIMFDPSPVVYLPEVEYVELYNKTNFDISLHNYIFNYGNYNSTIPDVVIDANSYLIICQENNVSQLESYGNVTGLAGFSLSNNGQLLSVEDNMGNIIHSVNYDASWISDANKTDGGWSLEQIDPNTPCGAEDNWDVSTSTNGGTPGEQNSIFADNPDLTSPEIIRAVIADTNKITVYFTETLVLDTITADYFTVDNSVGDAISVVSKSFDNTIIELKFNSNFEQNKIYKLTFNQQIADCAGNLIDASSSVKFAYADTISENDIVINEVLFNPIDNGVDYVEIYNRSNKVFDLLDLNIANKEDGIVDNIKNIVLTNYLIFPEEYILISKSEKKVKEQYRTKTKFNFIDVETMPTYANDLGTVVLIDRSNVVIDEFEYNEEMQFPLLVSNDGVSLERLNPDAPTNKANNWHSAAETVGFGTPGYENSQYNPEAQGGGGMYIPNEIFSPDNDGLEDNLSINYKFDKAGYVANLYIFDASGKLMIQLVNNELLGVEGSFIWNGIDQYNQKVNIGIYVIVLEVFDTEGNVTKYKDKCVVAGKI